MNDLTFRLSLILVQELTRSILNSSPPCLEQYSKLTMVNMTKFNEIS